VRELLGELQRTHVAPRPLEQAAGRRPARDVGVTADEARQEELVPHLDALATLEAAFAHLGDAVTDDADGWVADQTLSGAVRDDGGARLEDDLLGLRRLLRLLALALVGR